MRVPATWRRVRLSEICYINPRLPTELSLDDDTLVSFVPMASVSEISGEIITTEDRRYQDVKKGFTPFVDNDVLFAKITPSMENGKAAVARNLRNGIGFGSTEFHVIRCSDQVLPEFVFYFIRQPSFRDWAKSSFIGSAGQQRVPPGFLARILFLLPTIPEQQRIVEILKQADALRRQRREILDQAKQLPAALFLEMFGDPEKNTHQWPKKRIANICELVRGSSPRPQGDPRFFGGPVPRLMVADLTRDGLYVTPRIDSLTEIGAKKSRPMHAGEVVMAVSGAPGLPAILSIDACIHDGFVGFRDLASDVIPEYLAAVLNYYRVSNEKQAVGAVFKNLKTDQVKNWTILMPPISLQTKYRDSLLELMRVISRMEETDHALTVYLTIFTGLAFIGELTEMWREAHHAELETWLRDHAEQLPKKTARIAITAIAPRERATPSRPARRWLTDQLSAVQQHVRRALEEWKGTLIPAEDLGRFLEEWPIEDLEDAHDQVLRALNQLAGLGIIARVSIPNQMGEYVSGYRVLREDELSKFNDERRLGAPA